MSKDPAASVIVLGFNGRDYVDGCLSSVLDQDFERSYEVLFLDNGSRDGTAEAAECYESVSVHRLGKNFGYCLGNNKGFELATAGLVVFLNQDVVVHRSWLKELVALVEGDPSIMAGHANVIHPWNSEYAAMERVAPVRAAYTAELTPLGFVAYKSVPFAERAVDTLFLCGVSIILRRSIIEEIGGYVFDPDMFLYGEDMDLGLRIRSAGYRTAVATAAVVYHAHTLQTGIRLSTFVRTVRIIRNRLLALWKCTTWPEFLPLAAVTLAGAPFNSSQFGLPLSKKLLYFFLLIPPTATAAFAALLAMPAFASRRRELLAHRRVRSGWLFRTLLFDRKSLDKPASSRLNGISGA